MWVLSRSQFLYSYKKEWLWNKYETVPAWTTAIVERPLIFIYKYYSRIKEDNHDE